jgi:hypothetical protein
MTSGLKAIRRTAMGQGEFSWLQLKTSPYDLKQAVLKYRFCIVPKVLFRSTHRPRHVEVTAHSDFYVAVGWLC